MFEYYEEPVFTNDLLTLMYIQDGNVGRVVFTSGMDPKALPRDPVLPPAYAEVLSSFQSFLNFYRNLREGERHPEIVAYYKLKHSKLPFMALHSKYKRLKEMTALEEDATYYNEGLYRALLECNEYAAARGSADMFLAPFYVSRFFMENGEARKSRRLKREARKVAKISNRLGMLQELDAGCSRPD